MQSIGKGLKSDCGASSAKVVAAEAVEAWRRKRLLERIKTVELPRRTVDYDEPGDGYVFGPMGKTLTTNARMKRLLCSSIK